MVGRIFAFLKTLLPEQNSHFLFLLGLFFLLSACSSYWLPGGQIEEGQIVGSSWYPGRTEIAHVEVQRVLLFLRNLLLVTAFVAALPLLFLTVERPARNLITWVLLPISLAIVQFAGQLVLRGEASPFPDHYRPFDLPSPLGDWLFFLQNTPGFTLALVSLVLLIIAAWRVHYGYTSLPIRFRPSSAAPDLVTPDLRTPPRILLFLAAALLYPQFIGPIQYLLYNWLPLVAPSIFGTQTPWLGIILSLPLGLPYVFLMAWLMGGSWQELRKMFRPGRLRDYAFDLAILLFAIVVSRSLFYLWVEFQGYLGTQDYPLPEFARAWLVAPDSFYQTWVLYSVPSFLFTNILYRGFLQPRLVGQFGLRRGLFLVVLLMISLRGIRSSLNPTNGPAALLAIAGTVLLTLLLGWSFEYSRSVLPVLLLHVAFRMALVNFNYIEDLSKFSPLLLLEILCLSLACYWLFKRFPPRPPLPASDSSSAPSNLSPSS